MYAIWVLIVFGVLTGAYALFDSELVSSTPTAANVSLAANMATYRQAVVVYAQNNPTFQGQAPVALPAGTPTASMQNYVIPNNLLPNTNGVPGSLVVIYGLSSSSGAAAMDVEQMAQGSALAGVALAGNVQSPGNQSVPLPAEIAATVPNGAVVWMAQAYL
ncbi:type IV pilus biogenesis protein PilM [Paraburkholderia sp.]|uniref:type IV pilus biogenesis protein PilM n=1 Tax=Paraburkholderia sp. TaxID=1926495 RepID=UPI003D6F2BB6